MRRNRQLDLLHLRPLSKDDVERLVTAYYGPSSPGLAAYLHERAEGHPLFTVELLDDLIARDLLSQDRDGFWLAPEGSVPVPTFLTDEEGGEGENGGVAKEGDDVAQPLSRIRGPEQ